MSRLIDADVLKRKAQKEATEAWKMKITAKIETILNQFIDWIDNAPTIEPEPQWIPCSEKLPEEYGNYLITTHDGNVDIGTINPKNKNMWSACDADGFYWLGNVVAWMPIPEPYREEGEK